MGVIAEYKLLARSLERRAELALKQHQRKNRTKNKNTEKLSESLLNTATEDSYDAAKLSEERNAMNADIVERDFDARSTKSATSSSGRKNTIKQEEEEEKEKERQLCKEKRKK